MSELLSLAFLAQLLRIAVPYTCAAMGGVVSERSGVIDIALEGKLLAGAFGAAVVALETGSAPLGVLGGLGAAMLVSALHAIATVRFRADSVVTGVALNLLAIGLTRLLLRRLYDSSSNSPQLPALVGETASQGVWAVLGLVGHPLFVATIVVVLGVHAIIARTRLGLRIRAVGEHPEAAETMGVSPRRVRAISVLASGAIAGLGGVWLVFAQRQFTNEMSAGRGFIALAAVIIGSWRPLPAALACVAFAGLEALQIGLQGTLDVPSQVLTALPFVATLVAVTGFVRRARAPAALGRPYPAD